MPDVDLQKVCVRAQELWKETIGKHSRLHQRRRVSYGMTRTCPSASASATGSGTLPSERGFRKRLHSQIVEKSANVDHTTTLNAYAIDHAWTAAHQKERQFNLDKLHAKKIEANLRGCILPGEKTVSLQSASRAEMKRRLDAFATRVRKARNIIDIIKPDGPAIKHQKVFVLNCWSDELSRKLVEQSCSRIYEEHAALVFIMTNPIACASTEARRVQWAAAMMGAAICVPTVYTHGHTGTWVQYKRALAITRFIWASPAFQAAHPRLWYLLLNVITTPGSNWTLVDLPNYLKVKLKFPRGRRVIAVTTKDEYDTAVASGTTNVFTPNGLLKFVYQIDEARSVFANRRLR